MQWMLAIWSLVPLPFLNPAWTSGSSRFMDCWSLTWRILSITLLRWVHVTTKKIPHVTTKDPEMPQKGSKITSAAIKTRPSQINKCKDSVCQCRRCRKLEFNPWFGKILWRKWQIQEYSCLENPMDRGVWQATVHGVSKSQTRLNTMQQQNQKSRSKLQFVA